MTLLKLLRSNRVSVKLVGDSHVVEYRHPLGVFISRIEIKAAEKNWDGALFKVGAWTSPRFGDAVSSALENIRDKIGDARNLRRAKESKDAKTGSIVGGVHEESGAIARLFRVKLRERSKAAFGSKKPRRNSNHIGVEIEFLTPPDVSRDAVAIELARFGVASYCELKSDGSVQGDGSEDGDGECDGTCREDCECSYCGETHYCEDEQECIRRSRNCGDASQWEYRDDCRDCDETETIEDCDCGGKDTEGNPVCRGEHVVCQGHCDGHSCMGYDDHENAECTCECNDDCGGRGGSREKGHELAIVFPESRTGKVLLGVSKALEAARAKVNKTCGLHVHLDMRNREYQKCFSNLFTMQKLLYSMVPRSRYENHYCKPSPYREADAYDDRYFGLNPTAYRKHKTVEVRLHSGTVNFEKIFNWVRLLVAIVNAPKLDTSPRSWKGIQQKFGIPDDLLSYIQSRVEKFRNQHGDYSFAEYLRTHENSGVSQVEELSEVA